MFRHTATVSGKAPSSSFGCRHWNRTGLALKVHRKKPSAGPRRAFACWWSMITDSWRTAPPGCSQHAAVNRGPEALQIVQGFRPDLVFLDIGLPGMGGRELAHRLRVEAGLTEAALVALSGYEPDAERLPREAAFDDYVVRPLSADTLDAILAEHGSNDVRFVANTCTRGAPNKRPNH
jgi:CheY-like chemotaxis protein